MHFAKEFKNLDVIDLEKEYKARDLLNLLRARTFRPNPSAYFVEKGRKVFVRVELEYEEET